MPGRTLTDRPPVLLNKSRFTGDAVCPLFANSHSIFLLTSFASNLLGDVFCCAFSDGLEMARLRQSSEFIGHIFLEYLNRFLFECILIYFGV